jgi:uncharacterized protein (TIGR00369 family)
MFSLMEAQIERVASGQFSLAVRFRQEVAQHHGFFHGGATAFLVDVATTCAAATLVKEHRRVITAEYKINLISPAKGHRLICHAEVLRSARTLIPVKAEVITCDEGNEQRLTAVALASIAVIPRTMFENPRRGRSVTNSTGV